jgi:DNA polymerase-3 subunit epsilon
MMPNWFNRSSDQHSTASEPIGSLRYVVLDTELTSLEHRTNRLLSVGAIAMHGPSIQLGDQFYRVVNPQCAIPAEGIVIHQLRAQDVESGEALADVLGSLISFVEGAILVGHFAEIDLKILRKEMTQTGHTLENPAIDTARVHQWLLRQGRYSDDLPMQLERLDLPTLAAHYNVDHADAHHALSDAFLTARLWQKMLFQLRAKGVANLKQLLRIAGV